VDKLRAINVFRRVVELGSFKGAAEDLALSKAAISKNINELEAYLQNPLINRTTRKMFITEHGQRYYQQVCSVLDDLTHADLSIIESSQQPRGKLRVSVPMSVGLAQINPAICAFMKLHSGISIEVVMCDQYIDLVEQGVDVAIRGGGQLKNSSLKARKLMNIKRVLCASSNYLESASPLSVLEDLQQHNCLIYSLSSSPRQWLFRHKEKVTTIDLNVGSYVVNNSLGLKQALLADLGIALIPKMLVAVELESEQLIELLPQWQADSHELYAIYPYHRESSAKLRAFVDFLVSYFATG